ncbi:MAG: DUF711 family protein, partial [Candidatus Omnitrophica bacterium]|nr:DUF711 family protein [Candidatus Omnitrophota bacterium]
MSITVDEVYETARMILSHHLDIRTTTLGINLKDLVATNFSTFASQVAKRITDFGRRLVSESARLEIKYGIPIVNKRIAVTPVSLIMESHATPGKYLRMAQVLDQAAETAGIDFIGGFGCLCQKGLTRSDRILLNCLPEILSQTKRICSFINAGSTASGMNMEAINLLGPIILQIAHKTERGSGCARLAVYVNAPEDNPFMAGAFHGVGEPDFSLNIGISGPGVVRSVVEKNPDCDLTELSEIVKRTVFKITRAGELIGRELAKNLAVPFGIVDLSLAPTTAPGDSVADILQAFGIESVGTHGTTTALALLIDAVKKGGAMATGNIGGISGTFIPVTEDAGMARAVRRRSLTLDKLEALTAICSVGLDMIAVPGNTP